jgi:hypothetical protein
LPSVYAALNIIVVARKSRKELFATHPAREARDAMLQAGEQSHNEPLVQFNSGSRNYGEVEWLRDHGADPNQPFNQRLREVSAPLETFGSRWHNEVPTIDVVEAVLPVSKSAN